MKKSHYLNKNKFILHFSFFIFHFICISTIYAQDNSTTPYFVYIKPDTIINKKFLIGDFDPSQENAFVMVDTQYTYKLGFYLQKDAYKAFKAMYNAALNDSVKLLIVSATRNCDYQKSVWDEKWYGVSYLNNKNMSKIVDPLERTQTMLKYVAMPQTSRHHWGTDIDLNTSDTAYYSTPEGIKLYNWLTPNAPRFGFCQPYTMNNEIIFEAYQEEKWHWSYIPLAYAFLKNYKKQITYKELNGFMGAQFIKQLNVINKYVIRIDTKCF